MPRTVNRANADRSDIDRTDANRREAGRPRPFGSALQIVRPSLHEEVVARVRDLIVENHLPAGERIAELELAAQLGVSRTPLREALKVLASEGLIELLPLRGAVVKAFTPQDAQDMLELIAVLEVHAARKVVATASDEELAALAALHARMAECFERRERPEYFRLNQEIHNGIVAAAHMPTLTMMHTTLRNRMRRIRYIGNESPPHWNAAMCEHQAIIDALVARDAEATVAAVQRHFDNTWPRVRSSAPSPDQSV
ncbi:MAG: GntR family transcriptional regulator [Lautropia sp.]